MSKQRRQQRGNRAQRAESSAQSGTDAPARSPNESAKAPPWWKRAGSWIADQYETAATAVSETVDNAVETVGDTWDVLTNSDIDIDWSDRTASLTTDMDEVLDLMPADVRAAIQLDRGAEGANEVTMELDYKNDRVTVVSKDVRIMGINTPTLTTTGVSLRDVRIVLTGEGGLPMVGNATKTGVDIQFSRAIADNITAQTKEGPISATRVELGRSTMSMSGDGKDMPTGETAAAQFYVSNAVIDGFVGADGAAGQVNVEALRGGLDRSDGTGFVEAGSIAATDAEHKGNQIGQTSVTGARVDMRQGPDGTQHTVAVSSASVGDVQTASGDHIAAANLANLTADYGNGDLALAASSLDVNGMSGKTSLDSASVSDLSVSASGLGGESWNTRVGAQGASLRGLEAGNLRLGSADVENLNLEAAQTEQGVTGSGSLDRMRATGLDAGDFGMGAAWVSGGNASLSRNADGGAVIGADTERVDVSGLRVKDTTVDTVGVDYFGMEHRGKNDATYRGGRVRASGVDAKGTTVGSVDGRGVAVDSRGGAVSTQVASGSVTDVRAGDTSVGGASVSGVDLTMAGPGRVAGSVDGASVRDLQTVAGGQALSMDTGSVSGVEIDKTPDALSGSIRQLDVAGVGVEGARLDSGSVTNLSGSHSDAASAVALDSLRADGLSSGSNSVGNVTVSGASAERDADGMSGRISRVDATDLRTESGSVASATVLDAHGTHSDIATSGGVRSASATGIDMGAHGAGAVWVSGASATKDAEGLRGGVDSVRGVDLRTGDTTVGEVNATGLSGSKDGDLSHLGLTSLDATDIAHQGDSAQGTIASARVRGAGATMGPSGVSGGASEVSASGIRGRAVSSGEGGGGMDPALVRSLGGLVKDADIRASVPMTPGRYGDGISRLGVDDDTQMNADVAIRDGHIVPGAARADFSRNLDGRAWVGARGAYLDTDGSLRADLAGAPNINLGKSMGLGKHIDTSVASHANTVADGMGRAPSGPKKESIADSFQMDNASVNATVAMGNGRLDMGSGNGMDLAGQQRGDNTVNIQDGPQQDLIMTFTRFLASSLSLGSGGSSMQAGSAAVDNGQVSVNKDAQEGTAIEGVVGNITLKNVSGSN